MRKFLWAVQTGAWTNFQGDCAFLTSAMARQEKLGSLELPSSPEPKLAAASARGARARAEKLIASLAPGVDWNKRCEALAELTQWAEGSLCQVAFFSEILRSLVEALKAQVSDRWDFTFTNFVWITLGPVSQAASVFKVCTQVSVQAAH